MNPAWADRREIDRIFAESGAATLTSPAERDAFARGLEVASKHLPSPFHAGLWGAGAGVLYAAISGRSIFGWGLGGYALGAIGAGVMDASWIGGYTIGFGTGTEAAHGRGAKR
jgi:hypothetical protein